MPTYVYKFVETGETIEVQQGFHDETLTEYAHPDTGETMAVKKVFTPVGVTFKGSGFFKTDSRSSTGGTKKDAKDPATGDSGASTSGGTDSGSSSGSSSDGGSGGGSSTSSTGSSSTGD